MTGMLPKLSRRALAAGLVLSPLLPRVAAAQAAQSIRAINILPIKQEMFDAFLPIMQANAHASRKEAGNESFWAFRDESANPVLYLFEQWQNKAVQDVHLKSAHRLAVSSRLGTVLAGPYIGLKVADVAGAPAQDMRDVGHPAGTVNVLVRLNVKPDESARLIAALAGMMPQARRDPGNLIYDLFQVMGEPDQLVLLERWESAAAQHAHEQQAYFRKFIGVLSASLASPMEKHVLTDVAP